MRRGLSALLALLAFSVPAGAQRPANTPDAVTEKLSATLRSALADPKVIENLSKLGTAPVRRDDATPAALKQRIASEIARWSPIIERAGASGQP